MRCTVSNVIIVIVTVIVMGVIVGLQRFPSWDSGDEAWEGPAGDTQEAT